MGSDFFLKVTQLVCGRMGLTSSRLLPIALLDLLWGSPPPAHKRDLCTQRSFSATLVVDSGCGKRWPLLVLAMPDFSKYPGCTNEGIEQCGWETPNVARTVLAPMLLNALVSPSWESGSIPQEKLPWYLRHGT